MTDPIGNMLCEIRNALFVHKGEMTLPASKIKVCMAEILKREGFIDDMSLEEGGKPRIKLQLRYLDRQPAIRGLRRVSSPGRRVYAGKSDIPYVMGGMGVSILSTNRGILTDREARRLGVGGEILCEVW